jgi:DNA-binding transcriptional ArsR family regulator
MPDSDLKSLDPATMETRAGEAEAFLRSLASRHRLLILCRLVVQEEASVGELVRALGLTQSNLSRHLATLREEGLVAARREGVTIYYRIGSERVRPILTELCRLFADPVQTTFCGDTPRSPVDGT